MESLIKDNNIKIGKKILKNQTYKIMNNGK